MSGRTFFLLIILFSLSSCALFKARPDLRSKEISTLLNAVKVVGEGRGRLTVNNHQNVFSYDALLKENKDWLLAVSIPLHGEEIMVVPDLSKPVARGHDMQSFEARIHHTLRKEVKDHTVSAHDFVSSLRNMLRFLLNRELGIPLICKEEGERFLCTQSNNDFLITVKGEEITIEEQGSRNFQLLVRAKNLTDSFFNQTEYWLLTENGKRELLGLELFWK